MSLSSHSQAGQMAGSLVMPGLSQGSAFHELLPADLKEIIVHVRLSVSQFKMLKNQWTIKAMLFCFFLQRKERKKKKKPSEKSAGNVSCE